MKHFKIIFALLTAAAFLTGCSKESSYDNSDNLQKIYSILELSNSDTNESETPETNSETEQIIKLLGDYGDFYIHYFLDKDLEEFKDRFREEFITDTVDRSVSDDEIKFYKVTNMTVKQFLKNLESLVTENYKQTALKEVLDHGYRVYNNDLYVSEITGAYGWGIGKDRLYIDSIEYPDDSTIIVNLTSFGSKNKWDSPEDIIEKYIIKILRTENGLRIDECDGHPELDLHGFKSITFGDEGYPL